MTATERHTQRSADAHARRSKRLHSHVHCGKHAAVSIVDISAYLAKGEPFTRNLPKT
ncbi:hypothetical protein F01_400094 [Burkholderia cenocepacia]|nr:hypothetical protein F01_400094 [Burkholderia cenocepacia]